MPDDKRRDESRRKSAGHIERSDPDSSIRSSIEDGTLLKNPLARSLLAALGAPGDVMESLIGRSDELLWLVTGYERWAPVARFGWAITDLANPDAYDHAAELFNAGQEEAAENALEEYWNKPGKLESAALRVLRIATHTEIRMQVGRRRHELIELAVADHRSERYHASIPVALAQTEGMVRDVMGSSPYTKPDRLTDEASQGGHPDILRPIFEASGATMKHSILEDSGVFPARHGILHGRALGYDSRRNSTKALIAVAELATFCRARLLEAEKSGTLADLDRKAFGDI